MQGRAMGIDSYSYIDPDSQGKNKKLTYQIIIDLEWNSSRYGVFTCTCKTNWLFGVRGGCASQAIHPVQPAKSMLK